MVVSWIRRGSNHPFVERVDLAARRFVHLGRVEVVGEVTSNQILQHCLLLEWSSGKLVALPSLYSRTAGPEFDKSSKKRLVKAPKIRFGGELQRTPYLDKQLPRCPSRFQSNTILFPSTFHRRFSGHAIIALTCFGLRLTASGSQD